MSYKYIKNIDKEEEGKGLKTDITLNKRDKDKIEEIPREYKF